MKVHMVLVFPLCVGSDHVRLYKLSFSLKTQPLLSFLLHNRDWGGDDLPPRKNKGLA